MTGNLIVRAVNIPRIGEKVYDGEMRLIGFVYDVFGPVKSPYVSVKPRNLNLLKKPVKNLFLAEVKGKGR
jgi:RNA-binding protein